MKKRRAGILLHVSSLPTDHGIGDLGPSAYAFVDKLKESHQSLWQVLPLNPTEETFGNSPYFSPSLFAGNPLFISPELLFQEGLLTKQELERLRIERSSRVNYPVVYSLKEYMLELAFLRFKEDEEFERFCEENAFWLEDYVRFKVLRLKLKGPWWEWREMPPLSEEEKRKEKFVQYLFFKQWKALKSYANSRGVLLVGDLPIYPAPDSADVWANRNIFKLTEDGLPSVVAGVPPDYFSPDGQLWGNPVYNWEELKAQNFFWWIKRIEHALKLFDLVRLDHFRGFVAFYQVPFGEKTAKKGWWEKAPAREFFSKLKEQFPSMPFIAEDLGTITEEVVQVRKAFGIPGMKVLAFAFLEDNSEHMPHNHEEDSVVYTTTHDNMPLKDWFVYELDTTSKSRLLKYLGYEPKDISKALVRLAFMSCARYRIIAMQDLLGLGMEARMNTPATTQGNWEWRLESMPSKEVWEFIAELSQTYGIDV
ncbi:MAG: 4-alpha-glucanotransferase [Aquificota bacterium]|nr:MAG: 4-alpha-glucanotransferase [Aquificota bacterium]